MSDALIWWKKEGAFELNRLVIEYVGESLGYIPITNLMESFSFLSINEKEEILPIMVKDGCRIRKQVYENGQMIYSIWVK